MLVNISHLSSHIGDRTILNDVSMIIEEQDKIAVVGVNGAGKSTFLSLIASRDPAITYKKDMTISYLPQLPQFNEELTIIKQAKEHLKDVEDYEIKASLNRYGLLEHDALIKTLSGGQRKRLALAIAMLKECDLLILDEPTNHLDTPMIETLEKALIRRSKALIMVTHDRYFLERITHKIVDITRSQLTIYEANYSSYLEQKAIHEEALMLQEHKRNQFLRKEIEWVRAGVQARTTKSKARLQHFEELSSISQLTQQRDVNLIHTAARSGKKTIELINVAKSYDGMPLFDAFSYQFKRFDRIGILGENGCGKTTLMNMIAGMIDYDGEIVIGETMKIGYFKQGIEDMPGNQRVLDYVRETSNALPTKEGVLTARNMCERFLFDANAQQTLIERLSGGEKRRLYLLKVLMTGPNVLLLDEPTNDLDIETLTILEDYLDDFPGIVITVSHDRYFLDRIVDGLFVFKNNHITYINGGYSVAIDILSDKQTKASKKEAYRQEKQAKRARRLTFKEQKELDGMDDLLESLESQIVDIDAQMIGMTDFTIIDELTRQRTSLEQTLEEKSERYLELLAIQEASQSS